MIQLRCASPFQTGTSRTAFRVCDNIAAVHLHKRRFDEKPCLAAAGTADNQHIFIPRRFGVFRTIIHRQPFRLRQEDVVVKVGVDVRRNVFGRSP